MNPASISNKLFLLNGALQLINTSMDLAAINARFGDQRMYFFLKERARRGMKLVERLLRDNRIPLSQEEADSITADLMMSKVKYRSLKLR